MQSVKVVALPPFLWPFTFSTFKCRWFSHLLNVKWSHYGLSPKDDLISAWSLDSAKSVQ